MVVLLLLKFRNSCYFQINADCGLRFLKFKFDSNGCNHGPRQKYKIHLRLFTRLQLVPECAKYKWLHILGSRWSRMKYLVAWVATSHFFAQVSYCCCCCFCAKKAVKIATFYPNCIEKFQCKDWFSYLCVSEGDSEKYSRTVERELDINWCIQRSFSWVI